MQLGFCTYSTYCFMGNKQLCRFRCRLCVRELSAWTKILQDYTTLIFLGKRLKFSLHKMLCSTSLNDIIKFSAVRNEEGIWEKDIYIADEDICTEVRAR
jgi:hypothetical protein